MKKQLIFAALAATSLFAACQKGGDNPAIDEGAEAKMGLTLSFPKNDATRATNNNASTQDNAVSTINVFIFNANDGSAATGNNTALTVSGSFTYTASNNTYTLNTPITTTSGAKRIYVGINLPAGLSGATSETTLKDTYTIVANALYNNTSTTAGVAMLGNASQTMSSTGTNEVTVNVSRMVAKISATKAAAFSTTPTAVTSPTFTVEPDQYSVGNTAKKIYPTKRMTAASILTTPGDLNGVKPTTAKTVDGFSITNNPMVAINASTTDSDKKQKNGRYVPEHSVSTLGLRSESTYGVIRGQLIPTKYTKIVSGAIDETEAVGTLTAGANIYTINYGGKVYFCKTTTDRDAVLSYLVLTNNAYDTYVVASDGKLYTFYYVYINRTHATDKLSVHRSVIYDIKVNSVKGIGQAGDPTAPQNPNPTGPDDPTLPVVETSVNLDVHVNVIDWTYEPAPTDLE